MTTAKLTVFAQADLDEIWSYIAENDSDLADKVTDELLAKFQLLAQT